MDLEWYLPDPRGIEAIGPLSTDDIINKLKDNSLSFDSFVCCPSLKGEKWHRVFEFSQFTSIMETRPICRPPKIFSKGIYQGPEDGPAVMPVEGGIVEIDGDIIIHNNTDFYKGKCIEVSDKSITLSLDDSPELRVGAEFYLTLYGSDVKTFTSVVALISRKTEGSIGVYELYFLRINPSSRRNVEEALLGAAPR